MGDVIYVDWGAWLDKKQLAQELGCSVSYVQKRTAEGMPSRLFAGKRQYRKRPCETWLAEHGYLVEDAGA